MEAKKKEVLAMSSEVFVISGYLWPAVLVLTMTDQREGCSSVFLNNSFFN